MEKITSLQNSRIKNIVKLARSKERKEQNLFLIEGARELSLALKANYEIDSVFVCPDLFERTEYPSVLNNIPENKLYEVSNAVFEKIAYREGSDGLLILGRPQIHTLANLKLSDNPFIIILEAVEKPGNLGAILRTADAARADAVIVCDPATDLYNPNAIRSSVGCLFTVQTAVCSSQEALNYLASKGIKSFAAELRASQWYQNTDFTIPSAIIMGTEADGLTNFWLDNADARIKIPMRGKIDSLNVSVSTAVLTFEAMRQRGF
ncbi:RNA methyltransferase [Dysgonomonas sp. Marseille-P4677]|uniref:TrmH family RNA methyltransferase n=1 Tax=Dysgonomonas sp. Marseille-P4677 TaxID=2364790 RepID=UPI00191460B4|nr:RNA methyltransferase [Dysgonomonas sp. Marseille-P4677]MBK5720829.1 RNA methyltransferase [Dysgonomonas sp. Marseille-P4677]